MSVVEVNRPLGHRPAPGAPTHREVLARSQRLVDRAAALLDEEALRMERDRMAAAAVGQVLGDGSFIPHYARASRYAADRLAFVVAMIAAERTNGFTRAVES